MLDDASQTPLVSIEKLRVEFDGESGPIVGVKDVSFSVNPGETVCVVGESGSGKSVTSLSLLRLVEFGGGRIVSGNLWFKPEGASAARDLAQATTEDMVDLRGNQIGMIFQEPMTALNPVFTIGRQLTDGLRRHRGLSAADADARAVELLREVRLPEPERRLKQYPHELSGGMRQRVVIAMAMACRPQLLIADEPTTALDVTIQAEILGLIKRLKREFGMAVLFITHDMAVVAQLADRVVVMRRGELVEEGPVERMFAEPPADKHHWPLYRDGHQRAFSVGFVVKDTAKRDGRRVITRGLLLEISAVPIPANSNALVTSHLINQVGRVAEAGADAGEARELHAALAELRKDLDTLLGRGSGNHEENTKDADDDEELCEMLAAAADALKGSGGQAA